ncbi:MAG: RHS repeat-associated core domain-containing protein [Planctomycetes bacterium]|nr:RHS repeat-associated core domain-containing protein [Planctomycetota bacterium]
MEKYEYGEYGLPTVYTWDDQAEEWSEGEVGGASTIGNTRMFTGREWDAEIGLYYYRARHYDPQTGRFVSPDPIGYEGDNLTNVFRYVANSPGMGTDPTGEFIFLVANPVTISAVTAATAALATAAVRYGPQIAQAASMMADKAPGIWDKTKEAAGKAKDWLSENWNQVAGQGGGGGKLPPQVASGGEWPEGGRRAFTVSRCGIRGTIDELQGTISRCGGEIPVRIDMIRGKIDIPFETIKNLSDLARSQGATSLRIEATVANQKFIDILAKRYGMQASGATDFIQIPLGGR